MLGDKEEQPPRVVLTITTVHQDIIDTTDITDTTKDIDMDTE
jgi:hypothetical protein